MKVCITAGVVLNIRKNCFLLVFSDGAVHSGQTPTSVWMGDPGEDVLHLNLHFLIRGTFGSTIEAEEISPRTHARGERARSCPAKARGRWRAIRVLLQ